MEKNRKREEPLRSGYTTGSCATAATRGALLYLVKGIAKSQVSIIVPRGDRITVALTDYNRGEGWASCAAIKDSGDDPDVTNGVLVYAKVTTACGTWGDVTIDGGAGIGRVTKPGLACSVGEAAINPVPRKMIMEEAHNTIEDLSYEGAVHVEISIPEGLKLAEKTFNPKLGIKGGISVLGTTGIVEPMSEKALVDTIKVEMDILAAAGYDGLVLTPGNYGENFIASKTGIVRDMVVKCSNFIGDALDYAVEKNMKRVILVGHIGKLVKVAGGAFNTHSKEGDRRMELLTYYAKEFGGTKELCKDVGESVTTEDAVGKLKAAGVFEKVIKRISADIEKNCTERVAASMKIGVMIYSNVYGLLGQSESVTNLLSYMEGK